uniref:Uncharacterized protein n=1 Tax=Anopheles maculatus TaxID=74869 RepID=A0A182SHI2_9DIPT
MFPALKKHLGGKKFESDAKVQKEVNTWLREADGEWYSAGIDKFIVRMRKKRVNAPAPLIVSPRHQPSPFSPHRIPELNFLIGNLTTLRIDPQLSQAQAGRHR